MTVRFAPIKDFQSSMSEMLPPYYRDSRIVMNLIASEGTELEGIYEEIQDVLRQFFMDTATWGLHRWEQLCGIVTDESKSLEQRRAVLKSKLRGIGTVTVELIKNVAEAYLNGEVSVQEKPTDYQIEVTFIGKRGIPTNLDDIKQAIVDIIPAHLQTLFKYTYLPWRELEASQMTWQQLRVKTWQEAEEMFV
ncbi:YmfQ family protein [Marinicrinis sediminis]|uniref:YmfQ family protein n=1 Tax=Marinicrinis sediminis TaxID=1652465 RepID=A0ABW5R7G7_9BACL